MILPFGSQLRPTRPATRRQLDALAALVMTGDRGEAAAALGITPATFKQHMYALHLRTGLATVQLAYAYRNELVLWYDRHGMGDRAPMSAGIGR